MRLLIDECLPRTLKRLLPEHTCCTVQEMAWAGIKNGALLSLAEAEFDALITIDQGFAYQQDLKERRIAILLLVSRSNQIGDLMQSFPLLLLHWRRSCRARSCESASSHL
jgi:predicted nuclease of predicted toxin-antitoxin system